jgi:superfamily II DNA/RNA helicase
MAASSVSTLQDFTGHNLDIPDSKVAYTSSLVNEICDDGKKAIVFSEFINTAKEISSMLDTNLIGTITGETSPNVRNSLLTGLEHCKSGAIVMTDVGGEGLDMQFVDCIVNHDLPWNPMVLEQRIGRLDRIGRDDREVMIHNILLEDSLDSHIINILKNKEMVTHKFGGYGVMIDPSNTLSSLNSSIQFSSLSSEIYDRDLDNSASNDYTSLSEESKELLDIISQLN